MNEVVRWIWWLSGMFLGVMGLRYVQAAMDTDPIMWGTAFFGASSLVVGFVSMVASTPTLVRQLYHWLERGP